jgi:hypothetical protein
MKALYSRPMVRNFLQRYPPTHSTDGSKIESYGIHHNANHNQSFLQYKRIFLKMNGEKAQGLSPHGTGDDYPREGIRSWIHV